MSECTNCKYFATCGEDDRQTRCAGYVFEKPATFPTSDQIEKRIARNADKISALEDKISALSMIDERRELAAAGEYNRVKALRDAARNNEDAITAACEKIEALKIENYILRDNLQHAIFAEAWPIIKQACAAYDGKPYGEKTADKIRAAVNEQGFGFYFDGYSSTNSLQIYKLVNGRHYGSYQDNVKAYAVNDEQPFVTKDNKLNVKAAEARVCYLGEYCDDIPARIKAIKKAFRTYKTDAEKALRSQSALNAITPSNMHGFDEVKTGADYLRLF